MVFFQFANSAKNHWFPIMVEPKNHTITAFDSFRGKEMHELTIESIARLLCILVPHEKWESSQAKRKTPPRRASSKDTGSSFVNVTVTDWKAEFAKWTIYIFNDENNTPMQQNSFDCGIFSLLTMESLMRGYRPTYTQKHVDYCRTHLVTSFFTGVCLLGKHCLYSPQGNCPPMTDLLQENIF